MVVLARPRARGTGEDTLEDDDVTENFLEKPYVELLGNTVDSSTLQRSLSARVRRRERVGMRTMNVTLFIVYLQITVRF